MIQQILVKEDLPKDDLYKSYQRKVLMLSNMGFYILKISQLMAF